MSSRAVRKTAGHTTEDDLAQVLHRVGINKHNDDDDDDETDLIISRGNNHRRNVFEMLADEENKDDEKTTVDNDNQSNDNDDVQQQSTISKTKRKRKVKKKNIQTQKSDQNDDEFLIESNESQQEPIATSTISKELFSSLLSVDSRLLNPINEMKKKFGSNIVEQIERENNLATQVSSAAMLAQRRRAHPMSQQRPSTRLAKQNAFIVPKIGWPSFFKLGLSMKPSSPLSETTLTSGNYFQFEYEKDYQRLQIQFFDSVDQHNLQGIMDILRYYPYHIDSLIHLSDVSRMQDDTPTAVDLIERALYSFQQSFHPLFSIIRGECRLEYRIQANRSFFISLFKNIIFIGERGCSRTALEFCKVLLSLDPIDDPLAILLLLDYYAIRSEEYNYLIRFHTEQNQRLNLDGLPNFTYSLALAYFRSLSFDKANEVLQNALIRFPSILKYLLDKLSVKPDRAVEKCRYFFDSERHETNALKCVQQLYIVRMSNEWKEKDELEFLRNNVNQVIQIIAQNQDLRIVNYTKLRETCYRRTPINVCRHIILSESNEIRGFLPNDMENDGRFYNVDPFPPNDSIASFQRPERPTMQINNSYNGIGMLLRSLLPNFHLENFLVAPGAQAGAIGGDANENDAGMLQALQESIRDFIRDIGLPNIGENQLQQHPPPDDDDDNENNHEFD
ncbi:unnamed protein product [Rotaria magnacalcarata]|uniref:Transcription factor 25 n=1 Tax=Rotaria magnacalcarata TaxID=392030 RepID=A0A819S7H3_9BILA|nr:unnamed protein product [Rotaria magnacalcarata]CAF2089570.1 unnamed protein product [Rotaria magnacalcarata]CAF4054669.1 unnamed protein product [Rotaria magnacalcarata]CAF4159641.1 unnamed protein product [Rotaria magnacalcarata]